MDDREHLDVILAMCRRLLRPVVRVLLRHGITYRHFAALSKALYVEVASTDYGLRGRPTNVARTALLTGLDRKEVKRLRDAMYVDAGEARRYARGDRIARVLAAWYQDPRYRLGEKPMELPFDAPDGPSFAALAHEHGGDVPATTLLKELKNAGAVVETAPGRLAAVRRDYMPLQTDVAELARSGSVLEDLGNTVAHNLLRRGDDPPRFERRATHLQMDARGVRLFREFIEQEGSSFLERVDAWLSKHEPPAERGGRRTRLGVGVYWIEDSVK